MTKPPVARIVFVAGLISLMQCCAAHAQDAVSSIDLTADWRFNPDPTDCGAKQRWFANDFNDQDWKIITAGTRWEDQGFPDLEGAGWYRRWVTIPRDWTSRRVWLKLGAASDECIVFCNGERINSFGSLPDRSFADRPLAAELTGHLQAGKPNLIALRVFDWGGSGGIRRQPCLLTTNATALNDILSYQCYRNFDTNTCILDVDTAGLGNERDTVTVRVSLSRRGDTASIQQQERSLAKGNFDSTIGIPITARPDEPAYELHAAVVNAAGQTLGGSGQTLPVPASKMPAWPAPYDGLRVLNSLVTELLSLKATSETVEEKLGVPRDGWVAFLVSPSSSSSLLFVDNAAAPVEFRSAAPAESAIAMLWLSRGEHRVRLTSAHDAKLTVRAIPELSYCYYLSNPLIPPYGPYDKSFLDRYVSPNVNTYVTSGLPPDTEITDWTRQGGKWLTNTSLPGLSGPVVAAPEIYAQWMAAQGVKDKRFGGLIVDEFTSASDAHYRAWSDAVSRLYSDAAFNGKTFYAFCGNMYEDANSLAFAKGLLHSNGIFALERYLCEEPSREIAERWMHRQLDATVQKWEAALPGSTNRLQLVLGFLSAPPENLDIDPSVDYHVLTEMQFHLIANDPAFFRLNGLMEYHSGYADEESIRWAYRLIRHYAIEGNRDWLSKDPYLLDHIKNPDFADGLAGWNAESASRGSIETGHMDGWSWLQGRYPRTKQGDTFAVMTRSKDRPNVIRQNIRNLEPGRSYSLKMFAADPQHLDSKEPATLSIRIMDGSNELARDSRSFQYTFPSNYAHTLGNYNNDHPAWFTYYRYIFKPTGETAEIVITDWQTPTAPGAPPGRQTAVNFAQIQPYHE